MKNAPFQPSDPPKTPTCPLPKRAVDARMATASAQIPADVDRIGTGTVPTPANTGPMLADAARITADTARMPADATRILADAARMLGDTTRIPTDALQIAAAPVRMLADRTQILADAAPMLADTARMRPTTSSTLFHAHRVGSLSGRTCRENKNQNIKTKNT